MEVKDYKKIYKKMLCDNINKISSNEENQINMSMELYKDMNKEGVLKYQAIWTGKTMKNSETIISEIIKEKKEHKRILDLMGKEFKCEL